MTYGDLLRVAARVAGAPANMDVRQLLEACEGRLEEVCMASQRGFLNQAAVDRAFLSFESAKASASFSLRTVVSELDRILASAHGSAGSQPK